MKKELQSVIAPIPDDWPHDPIPEIRSLIAEGETSLVVLDDDPTGTQTVYDTPVLMVWSVSRIRNEFARGRPLFYILTNSRSLFEDKAVSLALEIGANLKQAAAESRRKFRVISRSDSTLRGHFPAEVDALATALGQPDALRVIMPFFYEGGRYTIDDTHYVREEMFLTPAAETQFARDATFGYRASNLREWVVEKSKGELSIGDISSISLEDIRMGGPDRVADKLMNTGSKACIINALSRRDAEVAALSLLRAGRQGLQYICRSAASLVTPFGGLYPRPLLRRQDLSLPDSGGSLTVVGSYVPASTLQLNHLMAHATVVPHRLNVEEILSGKNIDPEISRLAQRIDDGLRENRDVVLYTSRDLVKGADARSSLKIVQQVSASLAEIVSRISRRPRYIMAKGGITSSDIATHGLSASQATVLGQILPGVPVWELGEECKFGRLIYIVFPGNVGQPEAMTRVVKLLGT